MSSAFLSRWDNFTFFKMQTKNRSYKNSSVHLGLKNFDWDFFKKIRN